MPPNDTIDEVGSALLSELPPCHLACPRCGKPQLTSAAHMLCIGDTETPLWMLGTRCTEGHHMIRPTYSANEKAAWDALGCHCANC